MKQYPWITWIPYPHRRYFELEGIKNEWIITTRIDSDDMFHQNAMKHIHRGIETVIKARPELQKFSINLIHGQIYDADTQKKRDYQHGSNMFITYAEHVINARPETVLCSTHGYMIEKGPLFQINTGNEMWYILCHKYNLSNNYNIGTYCTEIGESIPPSFYYWDLK